jgi:hypothetical protein
VTQPATWWQNHFITTTTTTTTTTTHLGGPRQLLTMIFQLFFSPDEVSGFLGYSLLIAFLNIN